MKFTEINEARSLNMQAGYWELWFAGGGRGGPEFSEFGFTEHTNSSELPDTLYQNLQWNNTFDIVDGKEIIENAEQATHYALEDAEEAETSDEEIKRDYAKFVKAARKSGGIGITQHVDDMTHVWTTTIKTKNELLHLWEQSCRKNDDEFDPKRAEGIF